MNVIIRPFNKERDSGLIFDSYPKGVYHGSIHPIIGTKRTWMQAFFKKVQAELQNCEIRIACLEHDPNTIIGYAIISGMTLRFVYVKSEFRRKGIGNLLTKGKYMDIDKRNLTRIGQEILNKKEKPNERQN